MICRNTDVAKNEKKLNIVRNMPAAVNSKNKNAKASACPTTLWNMPGTWWTSKQINYTACCSSQLLTWGTTSHFPHPAETRGPAPNHSDLQQLREGKQSVPNRSHRPSAPHPVDQDRRRSRNRLFRIECRLVQHCHTATAQRLAKPAEERRNGKHCRTGTIMAVIARRAGVVVPVQRTFGGNRKGTHGRKGSAGGTSSSPDS